jgi:tetratricopeptide (TPR) repeat protein
VLGQADRAAEYLRRSIEVLEPAGPSPELVRAYVWASSQLMLTGRADESITMATAGLAIAEALGLDGDRSQLLNNIGTCRGFVGDPAGLEAMWQAKELAERSKDAEALGRIYTNIPSMLSSFSRHREAVELCREGREVMRGLGATGFELFIGSNEAGSLMELGRYDDGEALAGQVIEQQRSLGHVPGVVNAGSTLVGVRTRRGRYEQARQVMDEILPLARGLGGAEFMSMVLMFEAELEAARGNTATARQAVAEAAETALSTPTVSHVRDLLPTASRLLDAETVQLLLDRVRQAAGDPAFDAPLAEAEAVVSGDPELFRKAAALYASLETLYQEARCRLEAGDLERAAEIINRSGLENGPLGARFRELSAHAGAGDH